MSSQQFKQFIAKLGSDPGLQKELEALSGERGGYRQVPFGDLAAFAAKKGYAFTVEDVSGELSDQQLEGVAGGLKTLETYVVSPTVIKWDLSTSSLMFKF